MTSDRARPKRAAEEYVGTYQEDDSTNPASKKLRFDVQNPSALAPDALEADVTLDADVIGGRGHQVRRNAVNIDGYDSDSDNEGFDARADAKAKEKEAQSKEEDDNDMFADLADDFKVGDDPDGDARRKDGKKKAVRFLDEAEIEGQVQNSTSGGHVSADFTLNQRSDGKGKGRASRDRETENSSESGSDDETRAATGDGIDEEIGAGGKKTHAPKLDAFNMRSEQEEGRFDDQGNYVRKAGDPDAIHDTWLEGLSKKDMRRAKEAAIRRDEDRRQRAAQDDAILTSDILKTLIPFLKRGETVLEALARLGKRKERKSNWQTKKKNQEQQNGSSRDVQMTDEDATETQRRETVEKVTGAADLLLTRGQPEIYDAERELLIRQYQKETGEEWVEPPDLDGKMNKEGRSTMWIYKWSDARDGGETHGPYDSTTMVQWNEAGYFGEGVEFLRQDSRDEWTRVAEFV